MTLAAALTADLAGMVAHLPTAWSITGGYNGTGTLTDVTKGNSPVDGELQVEYDGQFTSGDAHLLTVGTGQRITIGGLLYRIDNRALDPSGVSVTLYLRSLTK